MSNEGEANKGPSKKELKKLAKKAEKDAQKAAKKQGQGQAATGAATGVDTAKPNPTTNPTASPKLKLIHADKDSVPTLKAIFASKVFGVPLKSGTKKDSDHASACGMEALAHGPALVFGDQLVMGGNSMAKAIALLGATTDSSSNNSSNTTNSNSNSSSHPLTFAVDQWCEWERNTLRPSLGNEKKFTKALAHLEAALEQSKSRHIIGHAFTVADVVILVTLHSASASFISTTTVLPPLATVYLSTHRDLLETAQTTQSTFTPLPYKLNLNNPSVMATLNAVFENAIQTAFPDLELPPSKSKSNSLVNKTQNPKHGDYQCNACMPIFAALKKSGAGAEFSSIRSPQDVANALIDAIGPKHPVVQDLTVNGPGFVMMRIAPSYLQIHINNVLSNQALPKPKVPPTVCVVDFSSPNIAKEMHVGHLRSTIIGEAVCRILEYAGHDVKRVNHVGDWGTQFGMLIQYLRDEFPNFANEQPNITDLTEFYKSAKQRFDESPEFKKKSQLNVVHLQGGDKESLEIWKILCDISRAEFKKVYKRLDITVEECGESFYNDKIPAVIQEFDKAGMISIEEGGAKCVFVPEYTIPLMLQKSDGGFGYDSTDMAALKHRLFTLQAKRIIVITDFSQGDHFKMCNSAAKKIGWVKEDEHGNTQKLEHIGFGTVQGEDGKRFKTRSGDTVRLVDLLDEAVIRMEGSLRERISESRASIQLEEVHQVAETIGYSAVKYFDLRRNPTTNYKFSYDQMLDTKGNTAVYLLYAHARLESICTKAKKDFDVDVEDLLNNNTPLVIGHNSERNLALQLQAFTDVMEATLEDLYPYHICEYLYNTSIAASEFVTQCKVLGSPEMESRLLMCRATAMAMRECFDLLGIRYVMRI